MKNLRIVFLTFSLTYCGSLLFAQTITLTGSPSFTISSTNVLAGNNLDTMLETSNSITIDLSGTKNDWYTQVNKSDISWNGTVKIWVRRTGDGTGGGGSNISGGTTYQEITNTAANFFSGRKDRSNIPIQYKITGMNVSINATTNTTTITHTVYD